MSPIMVLSQHNANPSHVTMTMTDIDNQVLDAQFEEYAWNDNMDVDFQTKDTWFDLASQKLDGVRPVDSFMEEGDVSMTRHNSAPGLCSSTTPCSPPTSVSMVRHGSMPTNPSRPTTKRATRGGPTQPNKMLIRSSAPNKSLRFESNNIYAPIQSDATIRARQPVRSQAVLNPSPMSEFGGFLPFPLSPYDTAVLNQQVGFNNLALPSHDGQNLLTTMSDQIRSYSTPTSGVLTPSSSSPSEMSRQNSSTSNFFEVAFPSQCLESNASNFSFFPSVVDNSTHVIPMPFDVPSSNDCFPDSSCLVRVADDTVSFSPLSDSFARDVDTRNTMRETSHSYVGALRYRQRHQQIAQSARAIAPKPSDGENPIAHTDGESLAIRSRDGTSRRTVAIPKAPSRRREGDRMQCVHCEQYPEGFRGKHELRRHIEAKHCTYQKKWIAVDKSGEGTFLANCGKCSRGKQYAAYYNCAAHLRRAHFNPCTRRGKGNNKKGEGRGGKAGGNHPPIDFLKQHWMEEIEVKVPQDPSSAMILDEDEDLSGNSSSSGEMAQDGSDGFDDYSQDLPDQTNGHWTQQLFNVKQTVNTLNDVSRENIIMDQSQLFDNLDFTLLDMMNNGHFSNPN